MDDKTQQSILRILVETYQQEAAHTLLMSREADLREADKQTIALAEQVGDRGTWQDFTVGGVLTAFVFVFKAVVESAIQKFSSPWLAAAEPVLSLLLGGVVVAIVLVTVVYALQRRDERRRRLPHVHALTAGMGTARRMYADHSDLKERLQAGRHRRVAEQARLHQYEGKRWSAVAEAGEVDQVRDSVRHIAEIDANQANLEREYERQGGDYLHELLRQTVRGRLPVITSLYIDAALGKKRLTIAEWRKTATRVLDAQLAVGSHDPWRKTERDADLSLLKIYVDTVPDLTFEGLGALISACKGDTLAKLAAQGLTAPAAFKEKWRHVGAPP